MTDGGLGLYTRRLNRLPDGMAVVRETLQRNTSLGRKYQIKIPLCFHQGQGKGILRHALEYSALSTVSLHEEASSAESN